MPRILISAGHTAMDPGAIFQDMREADLNRDIAKRIIPYLQKADDVEVKAVPLDLPLFQRIEWINNTGYTDENNDILVEIHVNDSDGSKRGVEAWYEGDGDNNSQKLTAMLTHHLSEEFKWDSQGAKSEYDHELGMLTFLNRTKPAAALIEVLYMDNAEDIKILKDTSKMEEIAKSLATAILKYFSLDISGKELDKKEQPDFEKILKKQVKSKPGSGKKGNSLFNFPGFAGNGNNSGTNESDSNIDSSDNNFPSIFGNSGGPGGNNKNADANSGGSLFGGGNKSGGFGSGGKGGLGGFGGGNSGGLGGGSGLGGGFGSIGTGNGSGSMMMDRDQRKKMIEENYLKVLGRKPKQTDLNHFLNRGTSEAELIKKMIESQEHVDLIKANKELEELKVKHEKSEDNAKKLKTSLQDMKSILDSMNKAVVHKNRTIKHLENLFQERHGVPSKVHEARQINSTVPQQMIHSSALPKTRMESIIDGFITRFAK